MSRRLSRLARPRNWWIKTAPCEDNQVEATIVGNLKTMPTSPLSVVIQHLLADLRQDGGGPTDGELLARFLGSRDEDALASLVRRHASMVWGVCRRLLNHHDAEDAFQAAFLVLVRKAAVVPGQAVANWLYGVARQTALRLRATAVKRGRRETQVVNMPEPTAPEVRDADLRSVVDEELSRLPDHYRGVVVLCDLEDMTRKEAARQLGIPEGSVASRLARARALLAKRLAQRGVLFSGGSVAAVLSAGSASASTPPALVASTIKAASLLAAGQAPGVVTAKVAALTEGVVQAMLLGKLKTAIAVVLILGVVATGMALVACRTVAGQDDRLATAKQKKDKEVEPFTAWGKEVGGLQAGLGYPPGQHRTYYTGETAKLVVRVRNVSKDALKFQYFPLFLAQKAPTVADGAGKPVHFRYGVLDTTILHVPEDVNLAPRKEIVLGEVELLTTLLGTGRFTVQYEQVFGKTYQAIVELDPALSKLATGKLELKIEAKKAQKEHKKSSALIDPKLEELKKLLPGDSGIWWELREFFWAIPRGDKKVLKSFLAKDFVMITPESGRRAGPDAPFDQALCGTGLKLLMQDTRLSKETVLMSWEVIGESRYIETWLWTKHGDGWKLALLQRTEKK
jgi:RNA polymerase sigma factor (sigma-70 family)